MTRLTEARRLYAQLMAASSGSPDPRIEEIFAATPREDFMGPGPWTIVVNGRRISTPSADPIHLYGNTLVALDDERNNGEPMLHAMWIGKIVPKPGETVSHLGAGSGYYTAILARLVSPGGKVVAYEINDALAARAARNLATCDNVAVIHGDAVTAKLPASDIIYVNAGVVAPPVPWLKALNPGGRLVFPWRPDHRIGLAVVVTRTDRGYACDPFMNSWFIPCVGAPMVARDNTLPNAGAAKRSRSIWLTQDRPPDRSATAIFDEVWFSSTRIRHE